MHVMTSYYAVFLGYVNMQDEISYALKFLIAEVNIVLHVDLVPFHVFKYMKK